MSDSLYLAWRYLVYNRVKTLTLISSIFLVIFLPIALNMLLQQSQQQLMSRADTTPLLIGAKGNSLDLVMNSLYFAEEQPDFIQMKTVDDVYQSDLALPIPLYRRFNASGYPLVGTSLDYFSFRGLSFKSGRAFAILGECVIGSDLADNLGLKSGDEIVSSPENLFDLAGVYPLQMKIAGVLNKSHSPDDKAVFVDLKTAWVIQGLGHGHQDVKTLNEKQTVIQRSDRLVTTSEGIDQYNIVSADNLDSFHFHGDPSIYPLTAIIAVPENEKSATILRGRFLEPSTNMQIVKPATVIADLLDNIFKIKNFVDAIVLIVAVAMIMVILLVFSLSLRLRQNEIRTIFQLGCSRGTVMQLLAAEIAIIIVCSSILCGLGLFALNRYQDVIVHQLFIP